MLVMMAGVPGAGTAVLITLVAVCAKAFQASLAPHTFQTFTSYVPPTRGRLACSPGVFVPAADTGRMAANCLANSGVLVTQAHAPAPPAERPVTYTREVSTR